MIERGKRVDINPIDDDITCPNCGNPLTCTNSIHKCTSCEYQIEITEIDYSQCRSRICMICGNALTEDELQICQECKNKMLNNWRNVHG